MSARHEPIFLLREIERRSVELAFGLPQQEQVKQLWHGVGFRLGSIHLVVAMDQIREILELPRISPVPGAKSWVRGIANVRGTLMPILDLHGFMSEVPSEEGRQARALVVQHNGVLAGLVVDEVSGMRHFPREQFAAATDLPKEIQQYVDGAYVQDGLVWPVFDVHRVVDDPAFMAVAA